MITIRFLKNTIRIQWNWNFISIPRIIMTIVLVTDKCNYVIQVTSFWNWNCLKFDYRFSNWFLWWIRKIWCCYEEFLVLRNCINCLSFWQIAQLATSLSLTESAHLRDIQDANETLSGMVDRNKFNDLIQKNAENERKIHDLEKALQSRSAEHNKMILGKKNHHIYNWRAPLGDFSPRELPVITISALSI